jgi:hypothetical protein
MSLPWTSRVLLTTDEGLGYVDDCPLLVADEGLGYVDDCPLLVADEGLGYVCIPLFEGAGGLIGLEVSILACS